MSENSSFQEYKEYALKTGRETAFTEEAKQGIHNRKYSMHKRTAVLYDDRGLSLISFNDPPCATKTDMFSGVFFSCNIDKESTFTAKKRDFLDKLSFSKGVGTGNDFVDKKIKAESNDAMLLSQVFHSYKVQQAVQKMFKKDARLILGLNSLNLSFVSAVDFNSSMGIYVLQDWLFDFEKLNFLFENMKIIKEEMGHIGFLNREIAALKMQQRAHSPQLAAGLASELQ